MTRNLLLCIAAASLMIFPSTTGADEPREEAVVYTALRPANRDLYLFEKPDEPPRRLTSHRDLDYNAVFSPDGRWIVFCSERRGNPDLYALDLNEAGRSPRLLLDSRAMEDAPAFSPDGQRLVFVSTRDGNAEVYVMPFTPEKPADAGQQLTRLTHNQAGDFNPAFSPDGKRIAFSSDRDGDNASEIYVMDADGSGAKRLTRSSGWDGSPAWSADGEQLDFYSERDGRPRIYRMSADGSNPRPVSKNDEQALSPAPAPDGRLAYSVRRQGTWRIVSVQRDGSDERAESDGERDYRAPAYDPHSGRLVCHGHGPVEGETFHSRTPGPFLVNGRQRIQLPDRRLRVAAVRGYFPSVNPRTGEVASDEGFNAVALSRLDGSGLRRVFQREGQNTWRPSWSKDGSWLACTAGPTFARPGERADVWMFHPDGSGAVNLTADSSANDAFPDFSADGRQIVFRSGRDGDHEIYLMNVDGSEPRRLTHHDATDTMPAFDPTGDRIAFTSQRGGDYEVYLLELNGDGSPGKLRRMTHSPGRDTHPKFSPDGKWLVFASARGGINDETPLIPVFNPQPYGDIYVMRIADGKTVRLTHNKWEDGTPTWGHVRAGAVSSR